MIANGVTITPNCVLLVSVPVFSNCYGMGVGTEETAGSSVENPMIDFLTETIYLS
jgi:hypothetical protein